MTQKNPKTSSVKVCFNFRINRFMGPSMWECFRLLDSHLASMSQEMQIKTIRKGSQTGT